MKGYHVSLKGHFIPVLYMLHLDLVAKLSNVPCFNCLTGLTAVVCYLKPQCYRNIVLQRPLMGFDIKCYKMIFL